jgi:hypothetical protein
MGAGNGCAATGQNCRHQAGETRGTEDSWPGAIHVNSKRHLGPNATQGWR